MAHPPPRPKTDLRRRPERSSQTAGHITLDRFLDKVRFRRGDARIPITTIRSLETRKLVHREPGALVLHD